MADNLNTFMCRMSRYLGSLKPPGTLRVCLGLYRDSFAFYVAKSVHIFSATTTTILIIIFIIIVLFSNN